MIVNTNNFLNLCKLPLITVTCNNSTPSIKVLVSKMGLGLLDRGGPMLDEVFCHRVGTYVTCEHAGHI